MSRVLIVYESRYGQTEKISNFMTARLQSKGHSVDVVNLAKNKIAEPENYDGIIVGSGIYGSHYPRDIQKWAKAHSQNLNKKLSVFFSVCLAILQTKDEKVQRNLKRVEQGLFKSTSWNPKKHSVFGGALSYSKYNWVMKQLMRLISRAAGGETDTSRDYEYTNWDEVTRFTDDFAKSLPISRLEQGTGISL